MATKGSTALAVKSQKFDAYKRRIEDKKKGIEGHLKSSVIVDGPLAEFRAMASGGFNRYPLVFLLLISCGSYLNGKIARALPQIESEPIQMILEAVPVLTVLLVMLITGMLVRTSVREVTADSEAATTLMRVVEGRFENLAAAEEVLKAVSTELGEQKRATEETIKKAKSQQEELKSLGYSVGTAEIQPGTVPALKKFLATNGKILKEPEALNFARRWSELAGSGDVPVDTVILTCKKIFQSTGLVSDRQLTDSLSKLLTTPLPKIEVAKPQIDFVSIFKKLELSLGRYHEAKKEMDELPCLVFHRWWM